MRMLVFCLSLCFVNVCFGGTLVNEPVNLNDYIEVQFVPYEDNPVIKADGSVTNNGLVWVEKADPVFETEFVGYDYPFSTHDLSAFSSQSSGVIEVGFGKTLRETNYFNNGWGYSSWYENSQVVGVPEPSTIVLGCVGLLFLVKHSRKS